MGVHHVCEGTCVVVVTEARKVGTYIVHLFVQVLAQDVQHRSGQGLALLRQALLDVVDINVEGPDDDAAGQ